MNTPVVNTSNVSDNVNHTHMAHPPEKENETLALTGEEAAHSTSPMTIQLENSTLNSSDKSIKKVSMSDNVNHTQ